MEQHFKFFKQQSSGSQQLEWQTIQNSILIYFSQEMLSYPLI